MCPHVIYAVQKITSPVCCPVDCWQSNESLFFCNHIGHIRTTNIFFEPQRLEDTKAHKGIFKLNKGAKGKPCGLYRHLQNATSGAPGNSGPTGSIFRSPGGVTAGVQRLALWRFRPMGKQKFTFIEPLTIVNAGRKIQPNAKAQALPARMLDTA